MAVGFLVAELAGVGNLYGGIGEGELLEAGAVDIDFVEPPAIISRGGVQAFGAREDDFGAREVDIGGLDVYEAGGVVDGKGAVGLAQDEAAIGGKFFDASTELSCWSQFVGEDGIFGGQVATGHKDDGW